MNIIIIAVLAVLVSSLVKAILERVTRTSKKVIQFSTGGMPSTHSTVVSSVTTALYLEQGASLLFQAALIFSLIIVFDAIYVRHPIGEHARVLNKLSKNSFSERIGHTPKEVLAGIVLGIILATVYYAIL